jgi:hypothetical protein
MQVSQKMSPPAYSPQVVLCQVVIAMNPVLALCKICRLCTDRVRGERCLGTWFLVVVGSESSRLSGALKFRV